MTDFEKAIVARQLVDADFIPAWEGPNVIDIADLDSLFVAAIEMEGATIAPLPSAALHKSNAFVPLDGLPQTNRQYLVSYTTAEAHPATFKSLWEFDNLINNAISKSGLISGSLDEPRHYQSIKSVSAHELAHMLFQDLSKIRYDFRPSEYLVELVHNSVKEFKNDFNVQGGLEKARPRDRALILEENEEFVRILFEMLSVVCNRLKDESSDKHTLSHNGRFVGPILHTILDFFVLSPYIVVDFLNSLHAELSGFLLLGGKIDGLWGEIIFKDNGLILLPRKQYDEDSPSDWEMLLDTE